MHPEQAGRRLRRPSALRTVRVGDFKISYVPDGAMLLKPAGRLPTAPASRWDAYADHLNDTARLVANTGGLLVELGPEALLIDAGFGSRLVPDDPSDPALGAVHGGGLPAGLARLGRRPETIGAVAFTHLHADHIGWACADPPLFPAATFVVPKSEWAAHRLPPEAVRLLTPRLALVAPGEEVFPGVEAFALPGHTSGHTGYTITSRGTRLLAFGDALTTPLQIRHPEWSASDDADPHQSTRHRLRLIAELRRPDTIGFGIHFADVVFGRVQDDAWVPV